MSLVPLFLCPLLDERHPRRRSNQFKALTRDRQSKVNDDLLAAVCLFIPGLLPLESNQGLRAASEHTQQRRGQLSPRTLVCRCIALHREVRSSAGNERIEQKGPLLKVVLADIPHVRTGAENISWPVRTNRWNRYAQLRWFLAYYWEVSTADIHHADTEGIVSKSYPQPSIFLCIRTSLSSNPFAHAEVLAYEPKLEYR